METLKINMSKFQSIISEKKSNGFGERSQMYRFLKNEEEFNKSASFLKENFSVLINRKQENSQVREKIRKLMERFFWLHDFSKESQNGDIFELFEIVYKNLYSVNDFSVESVVNANNQYFSKAEKFLEKYKIWKAETTKENKVLTENKKGK